MKSQTLFNLPVLLPIEDAAPTTQPAVQTVAAKSHSRWLVPVAVLLAALAGYLAAAELAGMHAELDAIERMMQTAQF